MLLLKNDLLLRKLNYVYYHYSSDCTAPDTRESTLGESNKTIQENEVESRWRAKKKKKKCGALINLNLYAVYMIVWIAYFLFLSKGEERLVVWGETSSSNNKIPSWMQDGIWRGFFFSWIFHTLDSGAKRYEMENGKVGIRRRFNILDRGLKGQTMNYDTFNRARRKACYIPRQNQHQMWRVVGNITITLHNY